MANAHWPFSATYPPAMTTPVLSFLPATPPGRCRLDQSGREVPQSPDQGSPSFHGFILPTPTFVATGTTTVAPTASQTVRDGGLGVDNLASELKALRLQAQSTEVELAKLQLQAPARSPIEALRGMDAGTVVGSAGLALGLLMLFWWLRRRRAVRPVGAGGAATVESSFLPETPAAAQPAGPMPTRGAQPQPGLPAALSHAPGVAAVAAPSVSRPLVHDSAFRPSSLDVTFVEHETLDSSMMPVSVPRRDSPFAAPEVGLAFDPEAAAGEVERVRKSLAAKRSERFRLSASGSESAWRHDGHADATDSLLQSDLLFAGSSGVPTEVAGVDVLLDFPDQMAEPSPMDAAVGATAVQDQQAFDPDRELDVSVSLIQELRGLGLWSEARELANEVVNSAHAPLDADIANSLHQVQHGKPASGGERRKKERG